MSPYIWTSTTPTRPGIYWYRGPELNDADQLVRVYRDEGGEWSLQYGDLDADPSMDVEDEANNVDFLENWRGIWAGPVHRPRHPCP